MEQLKDIFFFILLVGKEDIPEKQLLQMLTLLASLSDFYFGEVIGLDEGTLFVEKAFKTLTEEGYNQFIDMYTEALLKAENYEAINALEL